MKKIIAIASLAVLGACSYYGAPVVNQADISKVDFAKLQDQKKGESCQSMLLMWLPIGGSPSVAEAAWSANISKVSYVDQKMFLLYPLFLQNCSIVYGE
jgi:PBP1b-binding outer membrane lipoprotein LpoB